jgi:inward rectifier potassium channel
MASKPPTGHHDPSRFDPSQVIRLGMTRRLLDDLYHGLLDAPWGRFLGMIVGFYFGINLVFAILYLLGGDCIAGAHPGSFVDAYFFSVQTFSTIGYGVMAPKTTYASLVVTLEAFVGLLGVAMSTGLMFSKFARPSARVLFSDRMVIARRNGKTTLTLRVANERGNDVIEASMRVVVLKAETTAEGEKMRRFHDLKLTRNQTPLFTVTWMVFHEVDAESPLFGETERSVIDGKMRFIVTLTGLDATFSSTIHARKLYEADQIVWGGRFADILSNTEDGQLVVDYSKFHAVEPLPPEPESVRNAAA